MINKAAVAQSIFLFIVAAIVVTVILVSRYSTPRSVEKTKDYVIKTNEDLNEAGQKLDDTDREALQSFKHTKTYQ